MSEGYRATWIDQYNNSLKTWGGTNGRDKENPYDCVYRFEGGTPSSCSQLINGVWVPQGFLYYISPQILPAARELPEFQNEELKAYSKLADKVRGHSFDASVFLGELRESLDLITSSTLRVLQSYRLARKGDFAGSARTLFGSGSAGPKLRTYKKIDTKAISDFWLSMQYGWLPLVADVYEGCEALEAIRDKQKVVYRATSSTRYSDYCTLGGPDVVEKVCTVKLKLIIAEDLTAMQSLNLMDPRTVAWELLPYSFVVDWFVPVGSYLSNASFFGSLGEYRVVKTTFRKSEFRIKWPDRTSGVLAFFGGTNTFWSLELNRSVLQNPPIPLPSFKSLKKALSKPHLENAAALVRSQISHSR